MKNAIALIVFMVLVISVLIFRSGVHEHLATDELPSVAGNDLENSVFQLHFHERRPFYVRYKDDVYGLVASPVSKVFAEAGVKFEWVETPAGRQLDLIKENSSALCALGWFKTPQRQRFAKFTSPIYQDKSFVAVSRSDNALLKHDDLLDRVFSENRLKLLVKNGYSYGNIIDQKMDEHSPWLLTTTANNLGMLEMIKDKRADYCFMTEEEVYDLLVHSSFNSSDFKIVHFRDIPEGNRRYLMCSKKVEEELIRKLNTALDHFLKISDTN